MSEQFSRLEQRVARMVAIASVDHDRALANADLLPDDYWKLRAREIVSVVEAGDVQDHVVCY